MRRGPWLHLLVLGLVVLPSGFLFTPTASGKKVSASAIRGQLREVFAAWDLDDDGYLDKGELAKAFRGADAKPYDYKKPDNKKADQDAARDKGTSKPEKKPDYSSYPDYHFLIQLDQNGDGKISKKEWETWARDYTGQLKAYLDAQDNVQKANVRYSAAKTVAAQRKALTKLQQLQRELKALEKKQKAFEKKLLQAMKKSAKG
jgi:Ca2+-binding EF-hand superfamily protein